MTTTFHIIKCLAAAALFAAAPAIAATTTTLKPAPNSTPLMWQSGYSYDGSGNIVAISGMSDSYLYDAVGRLVQASANTADHTNSQTFSYDAFGNLLEVDASIKIGAANPGYNATILGVDSRTNRLTNPEPCNTAGTPRCVVASSRGYDAAGNMRGSLNGDEYDLDPLNAILERRSAGGLRQRYLYDVNGERVAILYMPATGATPSSVDFTLRGVSPQVLRIVRVSGTGANATWSWRQDYAYAGGKLLATVVADGTTAGKRQHYHLDHLGTPRLITDDRGYKISLHSYWPFGEEAPGSDTDAERMKFTGHERDSGDIPERDLDYMHARYYGPVAGRFLSVDQGKASIATPQSWNRYAYTKNNPLRMFDPDGRKELDFTIRHFIQPQHVFSPFGNVRGDNRGFSLQAGASRRTELDVHIDTDRAKSPTGLVNQHADTGISHNFTMGVTDKADPNNWHNHIDATASRDANGNVVLNVRTYASEPFPNTLLGPLTPPITSHATIVISPDGEMISVNGTRTSSPSMEINATSDGQTFAVYQGQENALFMTGLFTYTPFTADCNQKNCEQSENTQRNSEDPPP